MAELTERADNCGLVRSNYYDFDNFSDPRCIKGGVYVGFGLFAVGIILCISIAFVRGIRRCTGKRDSVGQSKEVSGSTHHIIEMDETAKTHEDASANEKDQDEAEEQPYFKRVVYQSKYGINKPRLKSGRKKKSFFKSLRRLGHSSDSSDEDYENAASARGNGALEEEEEEEIDYENVGDKQTRSKTKTEHARMPKDNDSDEEYDYENVKDKKT